MKKNPIMGRSMSQDLVDELNKHHAGKWVALSPELDILIASANTFEGLKKKVGSQEVVYDKMLCTDTLYFL